MALKRATSYELRATSKIGRIGILMGGPSSERQISLKSGHAVSDALKSCGVDAVDIDIISGGRGENIELISSGNIDCAFVAMHGKFGEDGGIQEILEEMGLPYTCSGPQASRLAMDKAASREIFSRAGLSVPECKLIRKAEHQKRGHIVCGFRMPVVVKPVTGGSSIGMSIISEPEKLNAALDLAFAHDDRVIIEEYIKGREITVGVLGETALPVVEIIPKNEFFDFEAKYQSGLTEYIVPAKLDTRLSGKAQAAARQAHQLLGCHGCSRADMILRGDDFYILEVNAVPGLTSTSLLPKAAKAAGMDFPGLCLKLINLAYEKNKSKVTP